MVNTWAVDYTSIPIPDSRRKDPLVLRRSEGPGGGPVFRARSQYPPIDEPDRPGAQKIAEPDFPVERRLPVLPVPEQRSDAVAIPVGPEVMRPQGRD